MATRLSPDEAWNIRKHWGFTWIYKGVPRKVSEESPKNLMSLMTDWFLSYFWLASDFWHPKSPTLLSRPCLGQRCDFSNCCSVSVTDDPHSRSQLPGPGALMDILDADGDYAIFRCVWPWRVETWTSWNNMPNHKVWHLAAGCQKPKKRFAKGWKRAVAVFFSSKGCWKNHAWPLGNEALMISWSHAQKCRSFHGRIWGRNRRVHV